MTAKAVSSAAQDLIDVGARRARNLLTLCQDQLAAGPEGHTLSCRIRSFLNRKE